MGWPLGKDELWKFLVTSKQLPLNLRFTVPDGNITG
jgi:hypothetical protein